MDAAEKKEEFSIDYNDKGVFLLVYSTEDSSADLLDLVLKELTSKEITEYDLEAINSAIEEKTNKPIKIAEMPTVEEVLLVPPKITVSMTRDRMEANIQIAKDKNTLEPTYEMVMEAINNSNVTYGIDEEAIKAALRVSSTDFLFAKGTKAIPGENAYIVQHVEIKDHGKPAELKIEKNGKKRFVNELSPATIGAPCPFQEKWQELWNLGQKDESKKFGRGVRYYTNIKVIKDPANPANEGKIFLLDMSGTMKDKIQKIFKNIKFK